MPRDDFLERLRRFLEQDLGPAPRPTDAQIGMIVGFVGKELEKKCTNVAKSSSTR